MTTETQNNQLDHATARIVTELAAALLPHLKATVSAELTRTIESLPVNIDSELRETQSSLKRLRALFEEMTAALNSAKNSAQPEADDEAKANDEFLRSLEEILSDWKGILKANGRAHTRELSDFSADISEQVSCMKSDLPKVVGEVLEKALSSRAEELSRTADESVRALETRLTRIEKTGKIVLAGIFVLTVIAVVLYLKII